MLEILLETAESGKLSGLESVVKEGARRLLISALESEVDAYIEAHKNLKDEDNKRLVVRNGKAQQRSILTSAGSIKLEAPRVNDRRCGEKFASTLLPPFLRKSPELENLIPTLYLRGLSTGKVSETLTEYFGDGAGVSKSTVSSLCSAWEKEFSDFNERLITDEFVYIWADGVYAKSRLGDDKKCCLLALMGVTKAGDKQLISIVDGYRESKEAWKDMLLNLIGRGFKAPMLAIADGALGFWAAISELEEFKNTKPQRCWVHKIRNVLSKLPKSVQTKAKELLHDMMRAESKASAEKTRDQFIKLYAAKYPKATDCLEKNWFELISFFDFPAGHWVSIRTTNPLESNFASVKLRTKSTRGSGSIKRASALAFKLLESCEKRWRKIKYHQDLEPLTNGVEFRDGLVVERTSSKAQDHAA